MTASLTSRARELAQLSEQERTYAQSRPEVRALMKRQIRLEDRIAQLEYLAGTRGAVGESFRDLVAALPQTIWLTKCDVSKSLPSAPGAVPATGVIHGILEGYAASFQDVTTLVERLKASGRWTTVRPLSTLVTKDATSNQEAIAFAIQIERTLPGLPERARPVISNEAEQDRASNRAPSTRRQPRTKGRSGSGKSSEP